jgi:hypothetical protein
MKFGVFFLLEQPPWTTQERVYIGFGGPAAHVAFMQSEVVTPSFRKTAATSDSRAGII